MKWKEYSDKAFIWADCCPLSLFHFEIHVYLGCTLQCKYKTSLSWGFSLTKGHMETTPIVLTQLHRLGNTLNNQSQTEKPQSKSKSGDGINPDSKFKSPYAAGADSWLSASQPLDALFYPWNHCARSTMAGCLQFAIWLCILFKAVLSKYQSGFPSGCLSVCLWSI